MRIAFCLRPALKYNRNAVGPKGRDGQSQFLKLSVEGRERFALQGKTFPLNTAEEMEKVNAVAFDLAHSPFMQTTGGFLPILLPDEPLAQGVKVLPDATTITEALDLMAMLMTPEEREAFIITTNERLAQVRAQAAAAFADAAMVGVDEKDEASDNPQPPETLPVVPVGDLPPPVEAETEVVDLPESAGLSVVETVAEAPVTDEPPSGDLPPPVENAPKAAAKKAAKKK